MQADPSMAIAAGPPGLPDPNGTQAVVLRAPAAPSPTPDLIAILSTRDLLTGAALERIHRLEAESGERIDHIARKLGLVSDRDLASAYATLLGTDVVTPAEFPATPLAADRLQAVWLRHARVIPLMETEEVLTVAMADPLNGAALRALGFAVDKRIIPRPALPAEIEAALARLYGDEGAGADAMLAAAEGRIDAGLAAEMGEPRATRAVARASPPIRYPWRCRAIG